MMKYKRFLPLLFLAAEASLGLALQLADGTCGPWLRYAVVALAALFCLCYMRRAADYLCTQAALLFTLCADYFLVLSPVQKQLPAMAFFSAVQLCYLVRIYLSADKKRLRHAILITEATTAITAVTLALLVLGDRADALAVVSILYYATLLCNLFFAFLDYKRAPLLAWGLLLFLCCDTVVGLQVLRSYLTVPAFIVSLLSPGFDLVWAFYTPSQILLSLSVAKKQDTHTTR